ncbi:MATE family efflux transporter [Microaerobacter geothermalis]|uniref:MATE family efflux transporter n=1 Tax=Microaerobacter geothermalis TaxID=674972 RepID=UPI001F374319|nr:MATE family efflux transporter [Microaerobacter geothermalis]MCF6095222.1 MATE family efflux transporter [Microaerobacter geothermalis]
MNIAASATNTKEKLVVILTLAYPAMIENILQTMVGFIDTLFIAKLGLVEVAAVGATNAILQIYFAVFMALGVGATAMIARKVGAKDFSGAQKIAKQSVLLSGLVGILFGLLTLMFADDFLRIMGANEHVTAKGVVYFRIVAVPSIFISLMFVLGSILRGAGDTKTPMKVSTWTNLLNIVLDYVLIFGFLFIPAMGLAGAALATVLSRVAGTLLLFFYLHKSKWGLGKGLWKNWFLEKDVIRSLVKIATPAGIERLIMRVGQILYFGMIISMGTFTYAAHQIAGNIEIFSYMPGYGLAVAATTLVGQSLGAGQKEEAYQYGMLTMYISIIIMSVIGVLLFILSPWAASIFTDNSTVVSQVVTALRIDAFAQPFLAIGLVLTGALQGAGDTKYPMYSTAIGIWGVRVIGVYFLGIALNLGLAGAWLAIAIDIFVRAIFLLHRYRKKKWMELLS